MFWTLGSAPRDSSSCTMVLSPHRAAAQRGVVPSEHSVQPRHAEEHRHTPFNNTTVRKCWHRTGSRGIDIHRPSVEQLEYLVSSVRTRGVRPLLQAHKITPYPPLPPGHWQPLQPTMGPMPCQTCVGKLARLQSNTPRHVCVDTRHCSDVPASWLPETNRGYRAAAATCWSGSGCRCVSIALLASRRALVEVVVEREH